MVATRQTETGPSQIRPTGKHPFHPLPVGPNLGASYRESLAQEIGRHRQDIAELLRRLADSCEVFYRKEKWICILGM